MHSKYGITGLNTSTARVSNPAIWRNGPATNTVNKTQKHEMR